MTQINIPDALFKQIEQTRPPAVSTDEFVQEALREKLAGEQEREELPSQASDIGPDGRHSNGLAAMSGGWTAQQWQAFEESIATTEQVDQELWQ